MMVLSMSAVGLLLIIPQIAYQVQKRWDEATRNSVGATSFANETVGPVAVSWIARIAVCYCCFRVHYMFFFFILDVI